MFNQASKIKDLTCCFIYYGSGSPLLAAPRCAAGARQAGYPECSGLVREGVKTAFLAHNQQ